MVLDRIRVDSLGAVAGRAVEVAVVVAPAGGSWTVVAKVVQDSVIQDEIPDLGNFLVERQIHRVCRPHSVVPCSFREMEEGASCHPQV